MAAIFEFGKYDSKSAMKESTVAFFMNPKRSPKKLKMPLAPSGALGAAAITAAALDALL